VPPFYYNGRRHLIDSSQPDETVISNAGGQLQNDIPEPGTAAGAVGDGTGVSDTADMQQQEQQQARDKVEGLNR
jgi:hypothetical protein